MKKILVISGILFYIAATPLLRLILLLFGKSLHLRLLSRWTMLFSRYLCRTLRIKVIVEGDHRYLAEGGNFIISNHLSYLDGVVLGSVFAVIYTSKNEVKSWPLFGLMTRAGATIYIDRKKKANAPDYIQETAEALKRGVNVLVFPEGTSTNGQNLLPFQSVHFQAPLLAKSPILPVAINYTKINEEKANRGNRDKVCWYGQVEFYQHVLEVLKLNGIEAKVKIYPKMDLTTDRSYSRKGLSQASYQIILESYPLFN